MPHGVRHRTVGIFLTALGAALPFSMASAATQPHPTKAVPSDNETTPVANGGDAADDPAIWVSPNDPSQSRVIGTDKEGALEVYDLAGKRVQRFDNTAPNNVDVRGNLVAAADDEADVMRFYQIDPASGKLTDIGQLNSPVTEHGICMYTAKDGKNYVFPNDTEGNTTQWEVSVNGGKIDGKQVRGPWDVGGAVEGCVVNDATGDLYIGEEDKGIWKYGADPGDSTDKRTLIDGVGGGHLTADVEGLAIAGDKLIASSQGDNTFVTYQLPDHKFVQKAHVGNGKNSDGCEDTDGVDADPAKLGADFPSGLFVCQDGSNTSPGSEGNQDFKYVTLDKLTGGK